MIRLRKGIDLKSAATIIFLLGLLHPALAQTPPLANGSPAVAFRDMAPDPVAPATVSRTPDGAVAIRAVRIPDGLKLDGRLDEPHYIEVPAIDVFIQLDPDNGAPSTEKTEAWIFFDDTNIYVSARCWDSHPELEIANDMRRDSQNILQNESFTAIFDTFNDKRNGLFFQSTPLGAQRDTTVTDEGNNDTDWNAVWDVKTQRSEQGWTVEFAIPFKSLRYSSNPVQVWARSFVVSFDIRMSGRT